MISLVVLIAIFVVLFAAAFVTKRRFGILGLALTAGATVSAIWDYDAGLVVAGFGIIPKGPLADAIVPAVITVLPAAVLLFTGYKYKSIVSRSLGSLLFALFGLTLLAAPLGPVLPAEGTGGMVYAWILQYRDLIISVGVILAVVDLFLRKSAPPVDKAGKKKK